MLNRFVSEFPWLPYVAYTMAGLLTRIGWSRFTPPGRIFYCIIFPVHAVLAPAVAAINVATLKRIGGIILFLFILWLILRVGGAGQ